MLRQIQDNHVTLSAELLQLEKERHNKENGGKMSEQGVLFPQVHKT